MGAKRRAVTRAVMASAKPSSSGVRTTGNSMRGYCSKPSDCSMRSIRWVMNSGRGKLSYLPAFEFSWNSSHTVSSVSLGRRSWTSSTRVIAVPSASWIGVRQTVVAGVGQAGRAPEPARHLPEPPSSERANGEAHEERMEAGDHRTDDGESQLGHVGRCEVAKHRPMAGAMEPLAEHGQVSSGVTGGQILDVLEVDPSRRAKQEFPERCVGMV